MTNKILLRRFTGALGGGLVAATLSLAVTGIQAQEAVVTASADTQLEEVIVTARRRSENILEVPMSISAISEVEMKKRNIQFVGDLFRTLPGGASPGGSLILRGLSGGNDETAPGTTTTFTDDIPYNFAYMNDIDRVEVLRGPQGTLYGSNAIGGTIRIISNKPKLDEWELFGTVNYSREGSVATPDTDLSLGINIPLIENRMAMRINGTTYEDHGRTLNTYTGQFDEESGSFLRAQLAYEFSDDVRINLGYIREEYDEVGAGGPDHAEGEGYWELLYSENENSAYGYDVSDRYVDCDAQMTRPQCLLGDSYNRGTDEKYEVYESLDDWEEYRENLYTVRLEADNLFDYANFVYIGSYREYKGSYLTDWSREDAQDLFRTWIIGKDHTQQTTSEFRLQNSDTTGKLNWTLGGFYDKSEDPENPDNQWQYHAPGDRTAAAALYWWEDDVAQIGIDNFNNPTKNWNLATIADWATERALFADVSYTIDTASIGSFELGAGVRKFWLEDGSHDKSTGIWSDDEDITAGKESGERYKLTAAWQPDDSQSMYVLYSEGYRPGGNNGRIQQSCTDDPLAKFRVDRYESDAIKNYELGYKASLADDRITLATAIYQVDWTDMQTEIYMDCGFSSTGNAGSAQSRGIEFESTADLGDDLMLTLNASYTQTELMEDVESLDAFKGDDMTMVPDYNAYLALDKGFMLANKQVFARIDVEAYGKYSTHFRALPEDKSPSYVKVNLSARVEVSDNVELGVFVDNLLNREIITYRYAAERDDPTEPLWVSYDQERTISVRLDFAF